jgi:hypothetical protein
LIDIFKIIDIHLNQKESAFICQEANDNDNDGDNDSERRVDVGTTLGAAIRFVSENVL